MSLVIASLYSETAKGACASHENELVALMCEINGAHEINDLIKDICFCPLEMSSNMEDSYMIFEETMRPNSIQIIQKAAQHPSLLPIPDYVINDEVRSFKASESERRFEFSNGHYELVVLNNDLPLPPIEQKLRDDFHQWIYSRGYVIPEGFVEERVDMRCLATHGKNFEETYVAMYDYEKLLIEEKQYIFSRIT